MMRFSILIVISFSCLSCVPVGALQENDQRSEQSKFFYESGRTVYRYDNLAIKKQGRILYIREDDKRIASVSVRGDSLASARVSGERFADTTKRQSLLSVRLFPDAKEAASARLVSKGKDNALYRISVENKHFWLISRKSCAYIPGQLKYCASTPDNVEVFHAPRYYMDHRLRSFEGLSFKDSTHFLLLDIVGFHDEYYEPKNIDTKLSPIESALLSIEHTDKKILSTLALSVRALK